MNIEELRKKTIDDLKKELEKSKIDTQKFMSGIMQRKEKNTSRIKEFKRDVARIETIICEKLKEVKGK